MCLCVLCEVKAFERLVSVLLIMPSSFFFFSCFLFSAAVFVVSLCIEFDGVVEHIPRYSALFNSIRRKRRKTENCFCLYYYYYVLFFFLIRKIKHDSLA